MEATIGGHKKWRTDLSHLFKCWSLIKTSELIKDKAYEELKTFTADHRAIERLNQTIKRNDLKTTFDQTISLWNKAIDQYLNQRNFFAAAECMESLAEIEFKFGDKHAKRVSLSTLLKASKYFKKASQPKRALIVLKRVLTILELSPKNDISIIADRYEDCVQLYLSLDLPHLANVSQKMHQFLDPEKAREASFCSLNKCKLESYDLPVPSRVSTPSTVRTNNSDDEDSYDNQCYDEQTIEHQIEDKEWVQQQIRLLDQHNTSLFVTNYTDINDDNCQHTSDEELDLNIKQNLKPTTKLKSKQLLRKNLRQLLPETTDEKNASKKAKLNIKPEVEVSVNAITTQITPIPVPTSMSTSMPTSITTTSTELETQEIRTKRKRRLKPKELSEESPEKRLIKLKKLNIENVFSIDARAPSERLLCNVCDESILCYRWSIVTDHLRGKKHKEFEVKAQQRERSKQLPQTQCEETIALATDNSIVLLPYFENNVYQTSKCALSGQSSSLAMMSISLANPSQVDTNTQPIELLDMSPSLPSSLIPIIESQQNSIDENGHGDLHGDEYGSLDTPPLMDMDSNQLFNL